MAREYNFSLSPTVDEQTKFQGTMAATASVPAATAAIAKTPEQLLVDRINAQITKTQTSVSNLEKIAAEVGSLNPSALTKMPGETNTQFNQRVTEAYKAQPQPVLTDDEKAQGYTIQFVRTGAAGEGEYRKIRPMLLGAGITTQATSTVNPVVNPVINPAVNPLVTPTSTVTQNTPTGPTLASDVFKQTLALFFGPSEMGKSWVNELYNVVSKFYKQGVTTEEAFNMAVIDSEKNPALADFTKRFKGIYALQKMKQEGKAVTVPTVAEYFATEAKMGDVLKQSSLGELANEDFLGDVLSKGVSATEFANRITAIFDRIDSAPKDIKDTLSRYFPTVDRISLAKAIALGDKGAKELQSKVAGYEVLSAAEKQGLGAGQLAGGVTEERAYQYALGGETFDTALTKFGTVAAALPTVNKLTQIYGEPMLGPSGIEEAVFGKSAKQIKAMEDLAQREQASFSGRSGVTQGSLASQRRGAGLI